MGRWLELLKNKKPTHDIPTKPTKVSSVGLVGALPLEYRKFQGGESRSLKEIEPTTIQYGKVDKNAESKVEAPTKPTKGQTETVNVFDRSRRLPPGLIVCLPCLDHPECWTAWRSGTVTAAGHGPTQWDAILMLDRLERIESVATGSKV